jgi:type II secretory ATPase GspE/PulE/Tfp pilus assembly ATPase PilB-like protein
VQEKDLDKDFIYNLLSKDEKIRKGIEQDLIVDLVDSFLYAAIKAGASDIHLEPIADNTRVRYRIDGILYDKDFICNKDGAAVISRLKILSKLDIAEKRIPQDGKFTVTLHREFATNSENKNDLIDLRISTFPSIYGEKVVIRILDKNQNNISLNNSGMTDVVLEDLYSIIQRLQGFFLVTGPTGSGKTTTLYSVLSYLNDSEKNIVTMEDPVEYNLDGVMQSQINEKAGFTFEKGLRSILRQDPDIVMIGEIRDKETAKISMEAALTGHLVFSTLHTNDSIGAIVRLVDMGVEPFLINASLSGVLAQRLIRRLCENCKQKYLIEDEEKQNLKDQGINIDFDEAYKPVGCPECMGLGYKSRLGLFELLKVNDSIRDLISKKATTNEIKQYVANNKINFLVDDALKKLQNGLISLDELLKLVSLN